MTKMRLFYIIQALFSSLILMAYALMYPNLPKEMPIHWSPTGMVNGSTSKEKFFVLPISLLLLTAIFIAKEISNEKKGIITPKVTNVAIVICILIFLIVEAGLIIFYGMYYL